MNRTATACDGCGTTEGTGWSPYTGTGSDNLCEPCRKGRKATDDVTLCRCGMTLPSRAGGEHLTCVETLPEPGREATPEAQPWLALICHCYNPVGWHACHARAEQAAALGEPTDRDRALIEAVR